MLDSQAKVSCITENGSKIYKSRCDEVVDQRDYAFDENEFDKKLAELPKFFEGYKVDEGSVIANLLANVQPGYEDELIHQIDTLTYHLASDRKDFGRKIKSEMQERENLQSKVNEHARAAIFYREQQEKKIK